MSETFNSNNNIMVIFYLFYISIFLYIFFKSIFLKIYNIYDINDICTLYLFIIFIKIIILQKRNKTNFLNKSSIPVPPLQILMLKNSCGPDPVQIMYVSTFLIVFSKFNHLI